jgi:hypothetical protein
MRIGVGERCVNAVAGVKSSRAGCLAGRRLRAKAATLARGRLRAWIRAALRVVPGRAPPPDASWLIEVEVRDAGRLGWDRRRAALSKSRSWYGDSKACRPFGLKEPVIHTDTTGKPLCSMFS